MRVLRIQRYRPKVTSRWQQLRPFRGHLPLCAKLSHSRPWSRASGLWPRPQSPGGRRHPSPPLSTTSCASKTPSSVTSTRKLCTTSCLDDAAIQGGGDLSGGILSQVAPRIIARQKDGGQAALRPQGQGQECQAHGPEAEALCLPSLSSAFFRARAGLVRTRKKLRESPEEKRGRRGWHSSLSASCSRAEAQEAWLLREKRCSIHSYEWHHSRKGIIAGTMLIRASGEELSEDPSVTRLPGCAA